LEGGSHATNEVPVILGSMKEHHIVIVSQAPPSRQPSNKSSCRILVGKPEGKSPLGRPRRRRVDNIKMDLREIGWDVVDWIDMPQDRDQ
jgi:hypothetical protein